MDECDRTIISYLQPVLELWREGREQSQCTITGNCMSPLIQDGDLLFIRHGNSHIRKGDIAVYGEPGNFYVHRVIKVDVDNGRKSYILRPDNNGTISRSILTDEIIGKVVEVRGRSGNFRFQSVFWKSVNHFLGFIYYICWRSEKQDSLYWRSIFNVLKLWRKVKPEAFATGRAMLKFISLTHRMLYAMRLKKSK
jgi:signal peptidase I